MLDRTRSNQRLVQSRIIAPTPPRKRSGVPRHFADFFPTPAYATLALLDHEDFEGTIWDPCCGDGEVILALMTRLANANRFLASDLYDWGFNATIQDFLTIPTDKPLVENIITNLPYGLIDDMMPRALALTTQKFASFCRLGILAGGKRRAFFEAHPPNRIFVFCERVTVFARETQVKFFLEGKKETTSVSDCCWMVWDKSSTDRMKLTLIEPGRKHVYRDVTRRIRSHLIQRAVERYLVSGGSRA